MNAPRPPHQKAIDYTYMATKSTSTAKSQWKVDPKKCAGCGDCVVICPVGALKVKRKVAIMVDVAACCRDSCRICEYHCHRGAITAY